MERGREAESREKGSSQRERMQEVRAEVSGVRADRAVDNGHVLAWAGRQLLPTQSL